MAASYTAMRSEGLLAWGGLLVGRREGWGRAGTSRSSGCPPDHLPKAWVTVCEMYSPQVAAVGCVPELEESKMRVLRLPVVRMMPGV